MLGRRSNERNRIEDLLVLLVVIINLFDLRFEMMTDQYVLV